MLVAKVEQASGTRREVHCPSPDICTSFRMLLAEDGMGFSVNKTIIPKGEANHWHYKNHLESCYCVSGHGILTELATGRTHHIYPDTIYSLDKHDDHTFQAIEDVVLISVFNPPLTGTETHDADGVYAIDNERNNDE